MSSIKKDIREDIEKIIKDCNYDPDKIDLSFKNYLELSNLKSMNDFKKPINLNLYNDKFIHQLIINKLNDYLVYLLIDKKICSEKLINYMDLAFDKNPELIKKLLGEGILDQKSYDFKSIEKYIVKKISFFELNEIKEYTSLLKNKKSVAHVLLFSFIKNGDYSKIDAINFLCGYIDPLEEFYMNGDLSHLIVSCVKKEDLLLVNQKITDFNKNTDIFKNNLIKHYFSKDNILFVDDFFTIVNDVAIDKKSVYQILISSSYKNKDKIFYRIFDDIGLEETMSFIHYPRVRDEVQNYYNYYLKEKLLSNLGDEIDNSTLSKKRKI